jgi:drug/metabolite transporter (DMT)-like permease
MENYLFIVIADVLFALQFLMTGAYSRRNKGGLDVALTFSIGTAIIISIYMFIVRCVSQGFGLDVTWYSLLLSFAMAAVNLISGYFSIKSLRYINVSLYSVFMMLGGMIVPSVFGIIVGETLTWGKILCTVLIIVSMFLGVEKTGDGKKGAAKYYIACFFLNGCCGIIAKLLTMYPKYEVSTNDFLITYMLVTAGCAFVILLIITKGKAFALFRDVKNIACMAGYSVFHGVAEFCSLFTIANGMDVSIQQPLVSGGVLLVSFIISVIMRERQSWKSVLSFIISVMAVVVISFINIRVF